MKRYKVSTPYADSYEAHYWTVADGIVTDTTDDYRRANIGKPWQDVAFWLLSSMKHYSTEAGDNVYPVIEDVTDGEQPVTRLQDAEAQQAGREAANAWINENRQDIVQGMTTKRYRVSTPYANKYTELFFDVQDDIVVAVSKPVYNVYIGKQWSGDVWLTMFSMFKCWSSADQDNVYPEIEEIPCE